MRSFIIAMVLMGFAGMATAGEAKVGDKVWAQWTPNSWYHGTVDKTCEWGLHVKFDDGDQGCFHLSLIAKEVPMPATAVKVGARVLAKWSNGRLYPATITGAVQGAQVPVFFDDRTPFTTTVKDLLAL